MHALRTLVISLLLTLLLWGVISWPLPIHVFSGIPAAPTCSESTNVRTMIAGDHLQFLYHLWLAKDSFFGPTPLFYNPYEFNRGYKEDRHDTGMRYYLPFSLLYSLCSIGGHAAGWNGTGLLSLWITFIFTLMLARRYTSDKPMAYLAAAISILLPFRWITLLGGSPTGLSMMWVPIAFYGLDVMVRDQKIWGGTLAGAAIFFSGWSDPHVTFFTALAAPCWCIACHLYNSHKIIPTKETLKKLLKAAIPLMIFAICVIFQAKGTKEGLEDATVGSHGRTLSEVALFSPHLKAAWIHGGNNIDSHIYVGYFMTLLILAAIAITAYNSLKKHSPPTRALITASFLLIGMLGIVVLSTGTNNPLGGDLTWERLCKLLPPLAMIRQPTKIFIVLPVMMAIFLSITLPQILINNQLKKMGWILYLSVGLILATDYGRFISPAVCRLDPEQEAYAAVAHDAQTENKEPFALGLPLWPGDSHWTSLNQYYSTLHRIKMVNGYRPSRRQTYVEDIYERFESFNKGGFTAKQLENLVERGVGYIILQEDAYPEKVSPFPVSFLLNRLLTHPNIQLLKQDKAVWAFKIVRQPEGAHPALPGQEHLFPARLWQAENSVFANSVIMDSPDTSGGKYLSLGTSSNSYMALGSYPMIPCSNLCYMVRAKGKGEFKTYTSIHNDISSTNIQAKTDWFWHKIPVPVKADYPMLQLRLEPIENPLDVDVIILATDNWDPNQFEGSITFPATAFFHAGFTELESGSVILSPDREPAAAIFYGPKLPFPSGKYKITLNYSTSAEIGTLLGTIKSRYLAEGTKPSEIVADEPGELIYSHTANLRMAFDFQYNREAGMKIKDVTIEKLPDPDKQEKQTKYNDQGSNIL